VSTRLAEDWHNGRIYYELGGQQIRRPASPEAHPAREFLEWHNDTVFQG
jgi:putative restriction endonuclease